MRSPERDAATAATVLRSLATGHPEPLYALGDSPVPFATTMPFSLRGAGDFTAPPISEKGLAVNVIVAVEAYEPAVPVIAARKFRG